MRLRNDDTGYGLVTQGLHWLTFAGLVVQLVLGYLLDDSVSGRGRGRGDGSGRGRGGELDLDDVTVRLHIALGATILVLATVRLLWRRATPLPPWSQRLSDRDRVWQHRIELTLIALLFATPATGLALVLGDDGLLPLHVACHIALYATVFAHVVLVVVRGTTSRMLRTSS